jgi:APA family basic amino acid/polyamine antiporter
VVGEVIGVGIFLTPAGMAKSLGSPLWVLIVWLSMGVMTLSGALCLGELAAQYPYAGGGYVYLRQAYGSRLAFLFGWMSLLVMDPGLTASLAMGLTGYLGYMTTLTPWSSKAIAIAVVLVLACINAFGVRLGARLLRWLTVLKLGVLVLLAAWGFGGGLGDWQNFTPFVAQQPGSDPLGKALAGGMVAAFYSFGGWWDMSKMAGEVRDPARNLPRALILGVLLVTSAYITISVVFLYLVPVAQVSSNEAFAAQAGEVLFGRAGGLIFSSIVMISVLGSLSSIMIGAPRVYYAMAVDGLFFRGMAAIHPRFGTPVRAITLQAVLASALVLSGTFSEVVGYFIFVVVIFLALIIAGLFVLRRQLPITAGYRTPGYPWTPLLFLVSTAGLLVLLAIAHPLRSALGVGVVLLGIPAYHFAFKRRLQDNEKMGA